MVALFPSPTERDAKVKHEGKRMLRTIGLVLGSIAAGIVAAVAAPSLFSGVTGVPLPAWVLIRQARVARAWRARDKSAMTRLDDDARTLLTRHDAGGACELCHHGVHVHHRILLPVKR